MIYLENDSLEVRFPELHSNAGVRINFQRTLRLPDDGQTYHCRQDWVIFHSDILRITILATMNI